MNITKNLVAAAAAFFMNAAPVVAQTITISPDYAGGYYVNGGGSTSHVTPDYAGGASINTYGSGGSSRTTVTPDYAGGYTINTYGY